VTSNLEKRDGLVHCSVKNAVVLCETIVKESRKFELAHLKKKKKKKKKSVLSRCFLAPLGVLFVMKTLEGER